MQGLKIKQRPLLTGSQIFLLLILVGSLVVALDLNRRAQTRHLAGVSEQQLQTQIDYEATRQLELVATRNYVESDDYVENYARYEAGLTQRGETGVVPLIISGPTPTPIPPDPTPDPIQYARPWQSWWRLLTDMPQPSR